MAEKRLRTKLAGRRVALLAHPASLTRDFTHSLDALAACEEFELAAAFGPQHGLRGEKQDNMIESADFDDPRLGIPVFSLYGVTRRPTAEMMQTFDVLLVDLQDVGCRIYTWVATLRYVLEEAARHRKSVWVLDRPNPIGRQIEGLALRPGNESFVGQAAIPMRHGLTLGELGRFFVATLNLEVDYRVIEMSGWRPAAAPGYGWPPQRSWVNPSPNAANVSMARCFAGTVLVKAPSSPKAAARRGRSSSWAHPTSIRGGCAPRWNGSRPTGSRAVACANAGSSRRSTSTRAGSAAACRSTSTGPCISRSASSRGGSSRSHSRR